MARLRDLRADSAGALLGEMEGFRPGADRPELLRALDAITLHLHIIAVATLLVDGESQKFFLNLCRMAENARLVHELMRHRGLALPPSSWTTPLLGALAAGQFSLADRLGSLVRDTRAAEDDEYEDEFLWAQVLARLSRAAPTAAADVEPLLRGVEAEDPEPYAERAEVVRALVQRDGQVFGDLFLAAHGRYAADIEEQMESIVPETRFAPGRSLWLEGLALLRLGERAGISFEDARLAFCPPLALLPMTEVYDGDWTVETGLVG